MKNRQVEVLAPAGSMECLKAAILNGADAVYLGGDMFGARAYAGNFNKEELCEAIAYAHLLGKKIFLTINTLVKEKELGELVGFLMPYYEKGLDAVIIQDLGVLRTVRKHFPDLEIHASTQMTITDIYGARFAKKMGAKRVVPARELSLKEIQAIKEDTGLDMECFVHGALCYCYSGQCFMSSLLGGRSGNRGRCAGTCRLPFTLKGQKGSKNAYPLSLRDLCTIKDLPQILDHGVDSLKIEGRMKGPRYVGEVTRIYRKYVDLYLSGQPYYIEEKDQKILLELFNRGNFTDGYYKQYHGKQMMSMERPDHQGMFVGKIKKINKGTLTFVAKEDLHKGDILEIRISGAQKIELTSPGNWKKGSSVTLNGQKMKKLSVGMSIMRMKNEKLVEQIDQHLKEKKKEILKGKVILLEGKCAKLVVNNDKISAQAEGPIIEKAQNRGADEEQINKQLRKTGETHYQFDQLEIVMDSNVFVPGSVLKKLRREAFLALDQKKIHQYERQYHFAERTQEVMKLKKTAKKCPKLVVSMEDLKYLNLAVENLEIEDVYLAFSELLKESKPESIMKKIADSGKNGYIMLPQIARQKQIQAMEAYQDLLGNKYVKGLLVRNLSELEWLIEHQIEKEFILDYMLYAYNKEAIKEYQQFLKGPFRITYPEELNRKEMEDLDLHDGELWLYGYLPLMVSAQCVKNNLCGCDQKEGWMTLTDRYQKEFFVHNRCGDCINEIYNGQPIWIGNEEDFMDDLKPGSYRIHFTKETLQEAQDILKAAQEVQKGKKSSLACEFTKGHLKRGVL